MISGSTQRLGAGYYNGSLNLYMTEKQLEEGVETENKVKNFNGKQCCAVITGTAGFVVGAYGGLELMVSDGNTGLDITLLVVGILLLLGTCVALYQTKGCTS